MDAINGALMGSSGSLMGSTGALMGSSEALDIPDERELQEQVLGGLPLANNNNSKEVTFEEKKVTSSSKKTVRFIIYIFFSLPLQL